MASKAGTWNDGGKAHGDVLWDRQVTMDGWMEFVGTVVGVVLAFLLTLFHCTLFTRGRPRLADLRENIGIWDKQVGDCCHAPETLSWLRDTYGEEGWEGVPRAHKKGETKKKGLGKEAAGRPKPRTVMPGPAMPVQGGYMEIGGVMDQLGPDVKKDLNQ